jgi:hypothetical protein
MSADRPRFQQLQYALTAHIRDPRHAPAPDGIEDRRLQIYRDLLFNNIAGLLGSTFPVLRKLYRTGPGAEQGWRELVRDYFATHRAKTPLFLKVPEEFLDYLRNERPPNDQDPPFLLELAHYEWVELALSVSEARIDDTAVDPDGDLLSGRPVLSPLAWSLAYDYPVHRIKPDFRPQSPGDQPTFLIVYRNRNDEVGIMQINPVTARLIELIGQRNEDASGRSLLERIAGELDHPQPDAVVGGGAEIMASLRERDILLGTAR